MFYTIIREVNKPKKELKMENLLSKLEKAIHNKDEFSANVIYTRLSELGFPVGELSYCFMEHSFLLGVEDTSDVTGFWSETTTYYDVKENCTASVRVDQDGGEEFEIIGDGVVY